ncbi:DUF3630 family protein [Flavobacterium sp.]|uniref:DUF3630 family protein n=1 Tax=Flavobacterium sp. TaxID=239 RepID=UPI00263643CB|nr:DUF3630 family protein [Flavobacterium sp.]
MFLKIENKLITLDIVTLNTYEDIESIGKYLEKYFDAKVIEKLDGPDARVWIYEIQNIKFKLQHNSYGNILFTAIYGKPVMDMIYSDLKNRLA